MQCRECGFNVSSHALFCPACGARLVAADPQAAAPQGAVQSPSFLGPDATQAQPIVPAAVRPARPAPLQPQGLQAHPGAAPLAPQGLQGNPGAVPLAPQGLQAHPAAAPLAQAGASAMPVASVPAVSGVQPPVAKAAPPKNALPQPGDTLADRYRVEKFLGQGSLSNAYLCRDLQAGNREVVVKAMHARKSAEAGLAESYLFLAQSVSKYDSPGIARTYESGRLGQAGNTPYYAMEWVSGTPLRMWLMERLTFENRVLPGLRILLSLLKIFEAIHERGCYGCLKPENVFIGLSGPVVMDFGVVGFLTPQEFEFNSYARRYLPYMAPELRQDWSNLIPHSDYYSLGAILYEILAGRAPSSPLKLPSELSELFGIEADEIILKAMAVKPMDRFGTLEAFRHAVESLQSALLGGHAGAPAPAAGAAPGTEGSRTMRAAARAADTVLNPDESFAVPPGLVAAAPLAGVPPFPQASPVPEDSMNGTVWSRHGLEDAPSGQGPSSPGIPASEGDPYGQASAPESREGEAAHALRRFTHSPRSAFPEGGLPEPVSIAPESAEGRALSHSVPEPAGSWEGLAGGPLPDAVAGGGEAAEGEAAPEEPLPAWLWVAIALAGCSMVVLSAYLGLLLPQR